METKSKLPSAFQPRDKVGLQTLINLLQNAKDAEVVSVGFTESKVKYNIAVPIVLNREEPGQQGYFRLANIDSAFLHAPIENGFFYNDQVAIESRKQADEERIRNENKKAFKSLDEKTDAKHEIERLINYFGIDPMIFIPAIKLNDALDASWSDSKSLPPDEGEGFSDDVLIDTTGFRKVFIVGWYDFDEKKWLSPYDGPEINQENLKWQYLPLAKYEK